MNKSIASYLPRPLCRVLIGLSIALGISGCNAPQAEASAAYIAAEAGTAALIAKNPSLTPAISLLVADWAKYLNGTLTPADEVAALQAIVGAAKGKLSPTQAALLDGATQQFLANQNTSAPTPIGGAAAAIITDVVNGAGRALVIASPSPTTAVLPPYKDMLVYEDYRFVR